MRLYFVRHGQSEANVLHVISNRGRVHGLTQTGRDQARALASALAGISMTRVVSSPLLRAIQTAEILAQCWCLPVETSDALREYDCGVLEGRSDPESWRLHREIFEAWMLQGEWDRRSEGGESFFDVARRFVPFIEGLIQAYPEEEDAVLLVGHGGTYLSMLPLVLANVDARFALEHPFDHTMAVVAEPRLTGLVCLCWGEARLVE